LLYRLFKYTGGRLAYAEINKLPPLRELPAGLHNAGNFTVQGHLPETEPAQAEVADERAWTAATLAARVCAGCELLLFPVFFYQRFTCHCTAPFSSIGPKCGRQIAAPTGALIIVF
jgi:hypothetical protein